MTSPNTADTVRVFIALDIPSGDQESLTDAIGRLQSVIPKGVKWVDPGGIHLTLKFLGNVPLPMVEKLLTAMQQASDQFQTESAGKQLQLRLSGLGTFPNRQQARVLWAGTEGDLDSLAALQKLVDQAVATLGYSLEKRPFRPHLTIGRVRDSVPQQLRQSIGQAVAAAELPPTDFWNVDTLHLIRSNLTPSGAIYTSIGSVAL